MTICIIPARGGSKRIPRKNIRVFCGKPMVQWTIEAAQQAGVFERIILSSDDTEISQTAQSLGVEAPFIRPDTLSDDHATTMDVMAHAVSALNLTPDTKVCCLYATAPFVEPKDLAKGPALLRDAQFAMSVTSFPFPIQRALRATATGHMEMMLPENFTTRSQDLEDAFHDAGQFYWAKASTWATGASPFAGKVAPIHLPRARVQDIDTPEDWDRAEAMFRALGLDIEI